MNAAVLLAHGNNDTNVMTKNATAFYEAVKRRASRTSSSSTRAATAAARRT